MELQFKSEKLSFLQTLTRQVQSQELTQELRLTDGQPDVGRVLGCWAQPILRGKEWRNGSIGASGGVMAWVLYAPEDGSAPQCGEVWLPFQMKWDIPVTQYDGTIILRPMLRWVDARVLSARKLMVRADLTIQAHAYLPSSEQVYTPDEVPEDVQLLKRIYPVMLPSEAGEKQFTIEEELTVNASLQKPEKLVYYTLLPEVIDRKIMADKAVFRGALLLHVLYCAADGQLVSWDHELPFSQYAQLEQDYTDDASLQLSPVVTELELTIGENGSMNFKCGVSGQYVVHNRPMLELVEDAYSPYRHVELQKCQLNIPAILDALQQTIHAQQEIPVDASSIVDSAFCPQIPSLIRRDDAVHAQVSGQFQVLYFDADRQLDGTSAQWHEELSLAAAEDAAVYVDAMPSGVPQSTAGSGGIQSRADVLADITVSAGQGLDMIIGLELGDEKTEDPGRPSLILRRVEAGGLWQLAKACGSSIERIRLANCLEGEPEPGTMLLIPVI